MATEKILEVADDISLIKKRFEIMTVGRYRDKSKIMRAMAFQDRMRKKHRGGDSSRVIRQWRDSRYGSSRS